MPAFRVRSWVTCSGVMIGLATLTFDPYGGLTQTDSLALIRELLVNLVRLTRQLRK